MRVNGAFLAVIGIFFGSIALVSCLFYGREVRLREAGPGTA